MAAIEKRFTKDGKPAYRVRVRLRGHPTEMATFKSLTKAKQWAQTTESAIRDGRHFPSSEAKKHTLSDLVNRYIEDVLPHRPKSYSDRYTQLEWWKKEFGKHALNQITPALIVEGRERLFRGKTSRGKPRSNATVNRYLSSLSHAFTVAMKEWQWVKENPVSKVDKAKESRGRVRFLDEAERRRLLEACRTSDNRVLYPAVVLAISTGMRRNEILGLRWKDVDLENSRIILHETKNNERRRVDLVGHAHEVLLEYSRVRRIDSEFVFPGVDPSKPRHIRRAWDKALCEAQIEDFRFHDLRHTAASYLAMNGATPHDIAAVLGHKTLQMVKRYAHLSESHTRKVVESMNEKVFG